MHSSSKGLVSSGACTLMTMADLWSRRSCKAGSSTQYALRWVSKTMVWACERDTPLHFRPSRLVHTCKHAGR